MPARGTTLRLPSDFDTDWALAFLGARCVPSLEHVGPRVYARGLRLGRRRVTLECRFLGNGRAPRRLIASTSPPLPGRVVRGLAAHLFDLDTDLAPFRRLAARDAVLRRLSPNPRGLRVLQYLDPFEALVRAILGQQVSVAGARTLAGRLVRLVSPPPAAGRPVSFPTAAELAAVSSRALRGIGLTRARTESLHATARAVVDGQVRLEALRHQPTGEAESALCALPGVGPWTASYVLMRGLGHRDAFPASDLGVRKALQAVYGPALRPSRILEVAERWRPWRAYATLHLWDSLSRPRPDA